ncbi:HD-GYP domain-containing protein [Acidomonas methanolica]|uniref:Metal dependent phosphohydrolase n=2 Tax=Acidomonas methanolica TaxID=437 RepID=A0A023D4V6_ACIMT|nr:HD domain-containing phosphohydrolase [Acidomonas methanolica]TCS24777.1 HD domain-containing protein [Acidomonas methanolica]GAJ29168.1 metal dependent phosphohydrolase [Acidomonas methanolica NBRC 104435]GBQ54291.1 hypothetical protein AA0498_2083 [Acidomonas methanolica]GEK99854.1 hypothetical protein AME01nite_23530 [Acidomonas methanolica NBRC 104435]
MKRRRDQDLSLSPETMNALAAIHREAEDAARAGGRPDSGQFGELARRIGEFARHERLSRIIELGLTVPHWSSRHAVLTGGVMAALAVRRNESEARVISLVTAALVHDIGKIFLPDAVLHWPGPLHGEALDVMRRHVLIGHDLLLGSGGFDETALTVALHHHELLDGSGYPGGLAGDEIEESLRLATVCDIFAALIEARSYKSALQPDEALQLMGGMTDQIDGGVLAELEALLHES